MADSTTTSKSDLQAENDRLRQQVIDLGGDPEPKDPNHGIVGNFADIQRLGSIALAEGAANVADAVVAPPSVDAASGDVYPAQTAAGGAPPEQS